MINHILLYSFVEVVRHGGISAAANSLGIAKSAVSKHVTQLEQLLGTQLLQRSSRRLQLTSAGERLLPPIESLLAEGNRLLQLASEQQEKIQGLVRIAATPEFGGFVAQRLFPYVQQHYPNLRLAMEPTYDFADLQDPAYDLALRIGNVKDERLVAHRLGGFRRILIASPSYSSKTDLRTPQQLERERCLVFSGNRTDSHWSLTHRTEPKKTVTLEIRSTVAVKSFQILMQLAEAGFGIANVPDFLVRALVQAGTLNHVLPDWTSIDANVYIVYRIGTSKIGRINAVIQAIRELVPGWLDQEQKAW